MLFDGTFIDPPSSLVNIAAGAAAPKYIETSLLEALDKDFSMVGTLVLERLLIKHGEEKPAKSFYAPPPRFNIKTMTEMKRTVTVKDKRVTINGEVMCLRLMSVNTRKKMAPRRVMSFKNASVSISSSGDDGSMHSSKKSDIMTVHD